MKKCIVSWVVVLFCYTAGAQFYLTGEDPDSIKWLQIQTPQFRFVFPSNFASQAQRMANTFEHASTLVPQTLPSRIPVIPIIMHSQSAISNGLTSWAPRRIELYPVPYQYNMYSHNWYEQLAVHEFRHVSQFNRLNTGLTKAGSVLFGEMFTGIIAAFIPSYYFEGDAVLTETTLSNSGRGRQPWFQMETRAYLLENNKRYTYRKASLGSYRNYIPDIYQFGYLYLATVRDKYGAGIWDKTVSNVGKFTPLLPFVPWYNISLLTTGGGSRKVYRESFSHLSELWQEQDKAIQKTKFVTLNKRINDQYTNYNFPSLYKDSVVIAVKSGIDDITQFVKVYPDGREEKIYVPGMYQAENLSVSQSLITWNEYLPDIRWGQQNYSIIKTLDLETGEVKQITDHTRYYYPVLSPNAYKIAVIEYTNDHKCSLTIIKAPNGDVIARNSLPGNAFLMNQCWDDDNTHVYVIVNSDKGKKIMSLDTRNGSWELIYTPPFRELYQLSSEGDYIYFRSGYSGIENIYAVNKKTRKASMITSSRFGAYDPHVTKDRLMYSDYSSSGYSVVTAPIDTALWIPVSAVKRNEVDLNSNAVNEEAGLVDSALIPHAEYKVTDYKKIAHLFKIHSWMPWCRDWTSIAPVPHPVFPGFTIISQNELGTAITYAGAASSLYPYYPYQRYPFVYAGFTYSGFFPVINIESSYGGIQAITVRQSYTGSIDSLPAKNFRFRTYLPLNFSHGRTVSYFRPEFSLHYTNTSVYNSDGSNTTGYLSGLYRLQYYNYLSKAARDLTPHLGYGIDAYYVESLMNSELYGNYYNISGIAFLPGILKHQSITISGYAIGVQPDNAYVSGALRPARGYDYDSSYLDLTRIYNNMIKVSFDYYTPFVYPDLDLGVIYITRLWGSFFYDYSRAKLLEPFFQIPYIRTLTSAGLDLYVDFKLFHFDAPITVGLRSSYLIEPGRYTFGILFSTSMINF